MRKSILSLALAASLFLSQSVSAKVGIVDIEEVMKSSKEFNQVRAQMEKKYTQERDTLEKKLAEIKTLQEKIKSSAKVASQDQLAQQQKQLEQMQKDFMKAQSEMSIKLNKESEQVWNKTMAEITAVIKKVADSNQYEAIMLKASMAYYNPSDDITSLVIKQVK